MNTYDQCILCNKLLSGSQNKFCSSSCSARFNNSRREPRTEESRKKTSESLARTRQLSQPKAKCPNFKLTACPVCYNLFLYKWGYKHCSPMCSRITISRKMSKWLKDPKNRKRYKGNSGSSYMESSFASWLEFNSMKNNLNGYLTEIHFYNKETRKHGWADFVFPKQRLIIELDGSHHRNRKELDNIRDAHLKSRGWKVLRITQKEYVTKSRIEEIKKELGLS